MLAPPSTVNGRPYVLLDHRGGAGRLDWAAVVHLLDPPPTIMAPRRVWPGGRDVRGLARWLAGQREGNRNRALFWAACRAVETGLEDDLEELVGAAAAAGLDERETRRTIASAQRRAGGGR